MPSAGPVVIALFWTAAIACAVAQLAIFRSVFAHRTDRSAGEILWAVLPAIALALVLAYTWRRIA